MKQNLHQGEPYGELEPKANGNKPADITDCGLLQVVNVILGLYGGLFNSLTYLKMPQGSLFRYLKDWQPSVLYSITP